MTTQLSPGKNPPHDIQVIIEIPAASEPVKYEFDKDNHLMVVDRFMGTCMQYPCNYGFVPSTLSLDGDPVDVLVITPIPLRHGCMIRCRPVGVLKMSDDSGIDAKVLAVPHDKLSPLYRHVQETSDLPELLLKQIVHFFQHYKDLEPGKWVKIEGWENAESARNEIVSSIERFNQEKTAKL